MSASNGGIPSEEESNYFNIIQQPFPNIIDGKINTYQFLESSKGVVTLVDKFGKIFRPVTYDMSQNITKITDVYNKDKEKYVFLEDMILIEKAKGENCAIESLLWLRRGLHLFCIFFQCILNDHQEGKATEDLEPFLRKAYQECLEKYHGWVVRNLFSVLVRGCPKRKDLILTLALGRENREDSVMRSMNSFVEHLQINMQVICDFYLKHDLESNVVV